MELHHLNGEVATNCSVTVEVDKGTLRIEVNAGSTPSFNNGSFRVCRVSTVDAGSAASTSLVCTACRPIMLDHDSWDASAPSLV